MNSGFKALGLSEALVRAVSELGYTEPTPVQQQAIPVVLAGRDLLAGAQTGTGKTAGFVLPILQRLAETKAAAGKSRRPIRALILTPTRELAAQVESDGGRVRTTSPRDGFLVGILVNRGFHAGGGVKDSNNLLKFLGVP